MRTVIFLFCITPAFCFGQAQFYNRLAADLVDEKTGEVVRHTFWQVMERANLRQSLNTFYRVSSIGKKYYLDLKLMQGGEPFIVPRNGRFELILENGDVITLYNTAFTDSRKGDGALGYWGSGAEGMRLSFPIDDDDMVTLVHSYIARIRLYSADGFVERGINEYHSELFNDEICLVYSSGK